MVLDEKTKTRIKRLYSSRKNYARFKGVEVYRKFLSEEHDIKVSRKELLHILSTLPIFNFYYNKKGKSKEHLRSVKLSGSMLEISMDYIFMGRLKCPFQGFYLLIDNFSKRLYYFICKSPSKMTFRKALISLFGGLSKKRGRKKRRWPFHIIHTGR